MYSSGQNRVFQLKLDPLIGNSEWVVIDDQDAAAVILRWPRSRLLATTSYLDMLNDSRTGLSMMAARAMGFGEESVECGCNEGSVTAVESYLPMVSEILDSELLGEGLIPTLQHAHDMLLVENTLTIPWRATVYGQIKFTESGICHGLVLWIDWVMDAESSVVVSTGPRQRYWKQGVKLLSKPVAA